MIGCININGGAQDSVVLSQEALETWLSVNSIANASKKMKAANTLPIVEASSETLFCDNQPGSVEDADGASPTELMIPSEIFCTHSQLDPRKSASMKCISEVCFSIFALYEYIYLLRYQAAYHRISLDTNCAIQPVFSPKDVCKECVESIFTGIVCHSFRRTHADAHKERLYQVQHPRVVNKFDQCEEDADSDSGYWISKHWLKDWRLMKPKMHLTSEGDPSPDAPDFDSHVRCEHGGLSMNSTNRRRISFQVRPSLLHGKHCERHLSPGLPDPERAIS
jgi:hypothetical protein